MVGNITFLLLWPSSSLRCVSQYRSPLIARICLHIRLFNNRLTSYRINATLTDISKECGRWRICRVRVRVVIVGDSLVSGDLCVSHGRLRVSAAAAAADADVLHDVGN